MSVRIFSVVKKSICGRFGIRPGDLLISVDGNDINDILDYRFYAENGAEYVFRCRNNNAVKVKIPDISKCGLGFETYLMDKHRRCKNSCIFCFIDQLPRGMRESLYFKDDDSRLSFLFGNYITLTNLSRSDADRIIKMHISPINASVHTMNPELRVRMMRNPFAGESLKYLREFSDAGININAQLVLCPGINDGNELLFSLEKLSELESINSVAAVPVGLTKYRDNLTQLTPYDNKSACAVLDIIDDFNRKTEQQGRKKFVYASDEFYQLAQKEMPSIDYYDEFPQLDNGVGLYALMKHEFLTELAAAEGDERERSFAVATGASAYVLMKNLADEFTAKFKKSEITVYCIENEFFGKSVTVAGLVTGGDLISQLKSNGFDKSVLLLPSVMLRSSDDRVFLDDVTVNDVEGELNTTVFCCDNSGKNLFLRFFER